MKKTMVGLMVGLLALAGVASAAEQEVRTAEDTSHSDRVSACQGAKIKVASGYRIIKMGSCDCEKNGSLWRCSVDAVAVKK